MSLAGHLWTVWPTLSHRVLPRRAPEAVPWSTQLVDPQMGDISLRGLLRDRADSDACVVIVHGLGGTTDSFYAVAAARAADAAGLSSLRIALRGADRLGEDFYHAGLTADLEATLASAALARYRVLYVVGYSLGGHMTLRFALAPTDVRVKAVAAVSPPLDLNRTADAIDSAEARLYRRHILSSLNEIYGAVAARKALPIPASEVFAATTMRKWDSLAVVPRHGFGDVDNYYSSMSVGPQLKEIQIPALIVHSDSDPMVPASTYRDLLAVHLPRVTAHIVPMGGHVAFPKRLMIGAAAAAGLESQTLSWLMQHR